MRRGRGGCVGVLHETPKGLGPGSATFTCRGARSGAVTSLLAMLVLVETGTLHLLLVRFAPALAYALSATSMTLLVWLIADYGAMGRAAVVVEATQIHFRIGRRLRATIPLAQIVEAKHPTWLEVGAAAPKFLNPTKPSAPTVLFVFATPQIVTILDALRRPIQRLGIHVDDTAAFLAALQERHSLAGTLTPPSQEDHS